MGKTIALLAVAVVLCGPAAASAQRSDDAQIAKGRLVVTQACTTCHTTLVRMLQVHKQTPEQWKDTVYFMISRGAQVMPNEIDAVAAFLAQAAGGSRPAARAPGAQARDVDSDGRAILQRNCQQCHELATALDKTGSEEWPAVIARMTTYGARLTPADERALLGYLGGLGK